MTFCNPVTKLNRIVMFLKVKLNLKNWTSATWHWPIIRSDLNIHVAIEFYVLTSQMALTHRVTRYLCKIFIRLLYLAWPWLDLYLLRMRHMLIWYLLHPFTPSPYMISSSPLLHPILTEYGFAAVISPFSILDPRPHLGMGCHPQTAFLGCTLHFFAKEV